MNFWQCLGLSILVAHIVYKYFENNSRKKSNDLSNASQKLEDAEILQQPQDQVVDLENHVMLDVKVSGVVSYQWYRNGESIQEAISSTLVFLASNDSEGEYYCRITSVSGSIYSRKAKILVVNTDTYASSLVQFYLGEGTDNSGRRIIDIWNFSFLQLEDVHDYIQWLFPSDEPSRASMFAPVLSKKEAHILSTNPIIQTHLYRSLNLILDFWGLELHENFVQRSSKWKSRYKNWCKMRGFLGNHNFLRITRVLKCLYLCGLQQEADILFAFLTSEDFRCNEGRKIGDVTFLHWSNAVGRGVKPRRQDCLIM